MKLFMVHCGFYDPQLADGLYESHANYFIAAEDFETAKLKAKALPEFKKKKMHIDGLQAIEIVQGHELILKENMTLAGQTRIVNLKYGSRVPQTVETSPASMD